MVFSAQKWLNFRRATLRKPAHKKFVFLGLLMTLAWSPSLAIADEFIGVAAAMRGDVIRVSSTSSNATPGAVTSGMKIFLGDEIEVASGGRMQIMLLDETVFTLGSGARLTIDEFVYDPAQQSGSMTTNITKGAFRFVSGKLAKSSPKAMKVNLPSASLSIRGTQVAGIVEDDGSGQVVLVGPGPNAFGASLGAITVTNQFGSVDLTRPNFATSFAPDQPPETPVLASPDTIQQIEQSTGEDAETEIAAALGVENLEVVAAVDTDDDGIPDQIAGNSELGASIAAATSGTGATSDEAILSAVFAAISTAVTEGEAGPEDMDMIGVNLGSGAAALFGGGAQFRGDTTIDQLLNAGLSGSSTYSATDVGIACSNSGAAGCGGSYDVTDTWDFNAGTINMAVTNGTAALDYDGNGVLDTNIGFSTNVTIDYSASGPLGTNIVTTGPEGDIPGYFHVAAEFDTSGSVMNYGASQTEAHIGHDMMTNSIDWTATPGNSMTLTNQGGGALPGGVIIRNDAFLSNFVLGDDSGGASSIGNIASHELNIETPMGEELATGTVHGMAEQ